MAKRKNRSIQSIVNREFISDLLSGALYDSPWFRCGTHEDTPTEVYQLAKDASDCAEDIWAYVVVNGGALLIEDVEDEKEYKIDYKKIIKGFKRFMIDDPRHYAEIMCKECDFWSYDSLLQTIVFGEVIYG